jgi:fatty acid desaturase
MCDAMCACACGPHLAGSSAAQKNEFVLRRSHRRPVSAAGQIEWPTVALVVLCWGAFVVSLQLGSAPAWILVPVLGVVGALYGSLQHEAVHGHPTSSPFVNSLMVSAPLGLIFPLERYRTTHFQHHVSELTRPDADPESNYVTVEVWERSGAAMRFLYTANRTLAWRLVVGPAFVAARHAGYEIDVMRRDRRARRIWIVHLVESAIVVLVVVRSPLSLWVFLAGWCYVGTSLTLLRSFAEHRAVPSGSPSAVVRTGWFFSLLFLNNNLHHSHHAFPGVAWFRLPELHDELGSDDISAAGAGLHPGYGSLMWHYGFRPIASPIHPGNTSLRTG